MRLSLLALIFAALCSLGCAHPIDGVIVGLNESARVLTDANTILAEQHRRARDNAVADAVSSATATTAVNAVHVAYRPKWDAYDKIRSAWLAAAAIARAALLVEKAGGKPDVGKAMAAALNVAAELESLAVAVFPSKPAVTK